MNIKFWLPILSSWSAVRHIKPFGLHDLMDLEEKKESLSPYVCFLTGSQEEEDFIKGILVMIGARNTVLPYLQTPRTFDRPSIVAGLVLFTHKFIVERHPDNTELVVVRHGTELL